MPFIAKADLKVAILTAELNAIVQNDDTVVLQAISSAQAEIRGFLYNNYDVDTIFSETGEDRHPLLVQYCADMAVYHLVASTQAGQSLDDRKARYDRACRWLKMVRDDKHYEDLPRRESTQETKIHAGSSAAKRNNRY